MPVINASSLLLFRNQTAVGHSKSSQITINLDLPDATTKDSNGWKEFLACARGGDATIKGLTAYNDSLNFKEFADDLITRTKQVFYFKQNEVDPPLIIRAEGFIESADETAEYNSATTFDIKIKLTRIITADTADGQNWENIFEFWEDIAENWEDV